MKFVIERKFFDNEIYNVLTGNYTVDNILTMIKKNKKNIKVKYVKSKIINQVSYKINDSKFKKKCINFKGNIEKDIKETINLFKNINNDL